MSVIDEPELAGRRERVAGLAGLVEQPSGKPGAGRQQAHGAAQIAKREGE